MIIPIVKFFHLICGTSFFGITIAAFYYIARSIRKGDQHLIEYSLKASYFGDGIILFITVIQLYTAEKLVSSGHFTLAIPWIFIAYLALSVTILLWLLNLSIKYYYLSKNVIAPFALKSFYLINITMILIFIIIIHDAVTQSTWLDFLFRK